MWKAFIAISLALAGFASQAREIAFSKRFQHPWTEPGWNIYVHNNAQGRELLIALNSRSLKVEILNPLNGETLTQDRLDTKAKGTRLLETLSTRNGVFVVAFAGLDGTVELHALNNDTSFEIPFKNTPPTALRLEERGAGEIYLIVKTAKGEEVYQRTAEGLERNKFAEFEKNSAVKTNRVQATRNGTWKLWPATAKRGSVLSIMDPNGDHARVDLNAGDARSVSEVGTFRLNNRRYYFYVKDHYSLFIQNESEVSVIPNTRLEKITGAKLVRGAAALAVTLESKTGSRLVMMGLKKLRPAATNPRLAGN